MKSFSKLGNQIFIIIVRPEKRKPRITIFKENGLDVTEIHPPTIGLAGKKGIIKHLKYLSCLPSVSKVASKLINDKSIDYVYSYMPGTGSSVPAMRICSKHKKKFILDMADMYTLVRPKIVIQRSLKKADKILTVTSYVKNDITKKGIDSKKIFIIPNGVDLKLFDPNQYEKKEIEKLRSKFHAEKIIMFSGSLQELNIIIDSAEKVIGKFPNLKYIIIGDHREPKRSKSSWEKKVKQKHLEKYFEFLGRKPREEIPKYLLCADVCIDSFIDEPYYAAAHPIKLLEYGACGKPVVATRVTETEKIVKHNVYGLLAEPSNPSEYAEHLITILNSNELAQKMGMKFSEYIRTNFGWDKIAKDLQRALEN